MSFRRTFLRRALWQVHLWLGLIIGPVVGVVCLTGAIVVFRYELNRVTTPGTAYVQPQVSPRLTMDDLVARLRAAYPEDSINQASFAENGPELAWAFRSQSPQGHRMHTY